MRTSRGVRAGLLLLIMSAFLVPAVQASAATTFAVGDVVVGAGGNTVQWRDAAGGLVKSLTTATPAPSTTGMAFDGAFKLYATGFTSNTINTFAADGAPGATFGGNFSHPESIVFDAAGNSYVGQQSGNRDVVKLSPTGAQVASFNANPESNKGSDRVDLAADQCTIYYTSQGKAIKRYNVCTKTQLSDLTTTLPGAAAYDVRIIPSGGVIVADSAAIHALNDAGQITASYDAIGASCWRALALDSSPSSFWAADNCTGTLYKFNFGTAAPVLTVPTGATSSAGVEGLAVAGGITAARTRDVSVSQTDTPDPVTEHNNVQYLATATNGGTMATGPLTLTGELSGGTVQFVGGDGWTCDPPAGLNVNCARDGLAPGQSAAPVEIIVNAPSAGTLSSMVTVSATTQDSNPADNTNTETTTVDPAQPGTGTGFCKKSIGCTISTATVTSASDTTAGIVVFPPIAGATDGVVYTFVEEIGDFCGGVRCTGNVLNLFDFIADVGYNPDNPIRVILIHDASITGGAPASSATNWKDVGTTGQFLPPCQVADIAIPHPCLDEQFTQDDGSIRSETLWVPGDPRVGSIVPAVPSP